MKRVLLLFVAWAIAGGSRAADPPLADKAAPRFRALVFSRTAAFRHDSIPDGIAAIQALGARHRFAVDATEDAARFTPGNLARYLVVVFLNTTGDVLDSRQEKAFEDYIRGGGGFVGVHAAADTEYDWPWFGRLVGARFSSHPHIQEAVISVEDRAHPSTRTLPRNWVRKDEWYAFRENPRGKVRVLARVDETTYQNGGMGADHPILWYHHFDGGRSWYTAGGHTKESFSEPLFLAHLLGGIEWAAGVTETDPVR